MIIEWDPARPKKKNTQLIRETLINGGIIAYPTDTFYGMGCDLFNIRAIRKLYLIKRLDEKRALSIICRDIKELSKYAVVNNFAFEILKSCLPGPYTFILQAKKIMPKLLMTVKKEVGIRIPDHPVPKGVAEIIDRPVINTSARLSGEEVFPDPKDIVKTFKGSVDIVIDGGIIVSDPSTLISLVEDKVNILRKGKGILKGLLQE